MGNGGPFGPRNDNDMNSGPVLKIEIRTNMQDDPFFDDPFMADPYDDYKPPTIYVIPGPRGMEFEFSSYEIRELLISITVLTLAFAKVLGGFGGFLSYIIPSFLIVLTGFFMHEMGHKLVAQSYGMFSEFKMSMEGLLLAVITALAGFLLAAPGAVEIIGFPSDEQAGRIAFAGPIVNIAFAVIFFPFIFIDGFIGSVAVLVVFINSFLSLFNLIPYPPLDGEKILNWSLPHYGFLVLTSLAIFISSLSFLQI